VISISQSLKMNARARGFSKSRVTVADPVIPSGPDEYTKIIEIKNVRRQN